MKGFRAAYGASPLHLLALLGCLALSGSAVLRVLDGPAPVRIAVWFLGAVVAHDVVLYPLYALADRSLSGALRRRRAAPGSVNWVRIPALLSGLLLLVFWPVVTQHSEPAFRTASGLDQDVYLARFLLIVAALFGGSALLFAVSRRR
ncbi:MAG: Lipoprotein [Frankiales bacterium]|jgi:hypothetical protein|nr:Lipoprotein [Frankiales bacterium]